MEEQARDFSDVNSLEKAQTLHREGKLELLYLFPLEFGGQKIPQNTLYVPPGIAAIKRQIDKTIGNMVQEGVVSRYTAEPEYKGKSFVPSKIKIITSDAESQAVSIPPSISGDATLPS